MTKARVFVAALVVTFLGFLGGGAAAEQDDYVGVKPTTVTRDSTPPSDPGDPGTKVLGRVVTRAPIPITGGDIAGLTAVGMGAIGTGTLLLRRGRARRAPR